jgi:hypothetical protein
LLLEPQRTNIALYSEQFDNAGWTKGGFLSVTANVGTAPDGTISADKMFPTVNTDNSVLFNGITISNSTSYTSSIFVKASGKNWVFIRGINDANGVWFDITNGVLGTAQAGVVGTITAYSSGWYRCSVTQTSTFTTGRLVVLVVNDNNSTNVTVNGTDGLLIWGAQVEAGAYATSYIPTLAASVTRVADGASKTGISSLIGQTEGTLFYEFSVPANENLTRSIGVTDGTTSNRINISVFATNLFARVDVGGVNQVNSNATIVPTNMNKVAFRYKANDFAAYINGVKVITDTSGSTFSGTTLSSFSFIQPDSTSAFNGSVSEILFFKTALTDAELASLTTI